MLDVLEQAAQCDYDEGDDVAAGGGGRAPASVIVRCRMWSGVSGRDAPGATTASHHYIHVLLTVSQSEDGKVGCTLRLCVWERTFRSGSNHDASFCHSLPSTCIKSAVIDGMRVIEDPIYL
jgi:hypothetical protein